MKVKLKDGIVVNVRDLKKDWRREDPKKFMEFINGLIKERLLFLEIPLCPLKKKSSG